MNSTYKVLGMMSGSSLDGVDMAFCEFTKENAPGWKFKIKSAETIPYSEEWKEILKNLPELQGEKLIDYHIQYGEYLGEAAKGFITRHQLIPDFISSHGHTIFHQPLRGFTFQLGGGQAMVTSSGFKVICDFRTKDVALGGQGAPLVPIGDELLFSDYNFCLNIGGIANISFKKNGQRLAFDVCAANQLLNHLSQKLGLEFDKDGLNARKGFVNDDLLNRLESDPFFNLDYPKSLSNEYVRAVFIKRIDQFEETPENKLRTATEHIARQVALSVEPLPNGKMLITGGGAHNTFLINRIQHLTEIEVVIPGKIIIDYKEALIFALLGVLRNRDEINCLSSVTGASGDSSTGVVFHP